MGRSTTIGIDNDLSTRQAGISIWTTNDKLTRRVDIQVVIRRHPTLG